MYHKRFYVYIITNKGDTTFYIGVSDNLMRRMLEHKSGLVEGFSKKYCLHKLVYYEEFDYIINAIRREKQLKNWHRNWKISLIKKDNYNFKDLSEDWFGNEMPKQVRHDK
jgi:putative endonuclease